MGSRCLPHEGTFLEGREQATQTQNCKRSVNFLERASKNRVPVAYAVRDFFNKTPLKSQNSVGSIEGVIDGRKISASELKNLQRRVTKMA